MKHILLVILFGLNNTHNVVSQEYSKKEYETEFSNKEFVKKINKQFNYTIEDKRFNTSISLNTFQSYTLGFLEKDIENNIQSFKKEGFQENTVTINVSHFNFSESSSGNLILKSISKIDINGGDYYDYDISFTMTSEDFIDIKFKKRNSNKFAKLLSETLEKFSKKAAKKVSKKIFDALSNTKSNLYEICSIGCAKYKEERSINKAKLSSLSIGIEKAFGLTLTSESKIEDFGDVSDLIQTNSNAKILRTSVVEDSKITTTDNFICLLTNSIIKKDEN